MANRYWVASSSGNYNDTANWSTTSGGSGGASVPVNGDFVYFDSNGSGDCNITANAALEQLDSTNYTGTITVNSGVTLNQQAGGPNDFLIGVNATFTGAGTYQCQGMNVKPNGTFSINRVLIDRSGNLYPGVYDVATFDFHPAAARTLIVTAGDYTFTGDVSIGSTQNATWSNSAGNPNITFKGDVTLNSTYGFWSAGTGTITLDNTAAQAINFNGQTVEAVVVSDASTGAITLGANFTTPYVHDCDSLINLNGFTITETGTDPSPCSNNVFSRPVAFTRLG